MKPASLATRAQRQPGNVRRRLEGGLVLYATCSVCECSRAARKYSEAASVVAALPTSGCHC